MPVFFLGMGLRVDLAAAALGPVPRLALVLVGVAVAGKLVSGLAVPGRREQEAPRMSSNLTLGTNR